LKGALTYTVINVKFKENHILLWTGELERLAEI